MCGVLEKAAYISGHTINSAKDAYARGKEAAAQAEGQRKREAQWAKAEAEERERYDREHGRTQPKPAPQPKPQQQKPQQQRKVIVRNYYYGEGSRKAPQQQRTQRTIEQPSFAELNNRLINATGDVDKRMADYNRKINKMFGGW